MELRWTFQVLTAASLLSLQAGCASSPKLTSTLTTQGAVAAPDEAARADKPTEQQPPHPEPISQTTQALPDSTQPLQQAASEPRLRELCRKEVAGQEAAAIDAFRRRLEETICGANLWLDGLFGGEPDVENARSVSGRLEISSLYSEAYGNEAKVRLRVNYDLPNLQHRMRIFLGRQEIDEATEDRATPLGVRSAFFDLGERQEWLAGFGYSPPGRYGSRFSFRLGVRPQRETVVYLQARYRQNIFLNEHAAIRFRETIFWRNREHGFGSTTGIDFDRLINRDTIFRWGNVGTISQATDGLEWRSSLLLYRNLHRGRAISGELFVRGATEAEVAVEEYGARALYRQPIFRRWLFGELVAGYSFPRRRLDEEREGSVILGFGIDLVFGRDPF